MLVVRYFIHTYDKFYTYCYLNESLELHKQFLGIQFNDHGDIGID